MRRPHVYERSVPRAGRGSAPRPPDGPPTTTLRLRRLIAAALREAEALGLDRVATALEAASAAAEPVDAAPGLEARPETP